MVELVKRYRWDTAPTDREMPTAEIAECKRPSLHRPCYRLCESNKRSPSPAVVYILSAFHLATGSWPDTFPLPPSSLTTTPLPSISPRTNLHHRPKNAPLQLQPLSSGDGIAKKSKKRSQMAGTLRVNCRATPWTDFVPCTRLTRTHSHVRSSRTSSRSVQKPSAGYYGASGSHRERSGPGWQRGKEGAEKNGSREEGRRRRTGQLRSSPRLDGTTNRDRIKDQRESSQRTSSSSGDICPSRRAIFSLESTYIIQSFVPAPR